MAQTARKQRNNVVHLNRAHKYKYRFNKSKEKDPVIGVLWEMVVADGRSLTAIANEACLSYHSLHSWFFGDTKRPQRASISMLAKALGCPKMGFLNADSRVVREFGWFEPWKRNR